MRKQKLTSVFAKTTAVMGGCALALLSITGGAAAVQHIINENTATPSAQLYVEALSDDHINLARKIAQQDAGFIRVIKKAGVNKILSAPVHDKQGRIEKVLLTYTLSKPFLV